MLTNCRSCGKECTDRLRIAVYKSKPPYIFCKECFNFLLDKPIEEIKKILPKD